SILSGSINFILPNGTSDVIQYSEKELNTIRGDCISMIFQEPMTSLNPSIRCGFQAMETLIVKKKMPATKAKEKILELFREVMLPDVSRIFQAWPHELSGGQKQRVMIAMALANSPDLLIADEPTTALDVTVQKSILELLLKLKAKFNLSILFITHDLMVLNQIADEIVVMYNGEIVESGNKDTIMTKPSNPYTKGLLACKPGLENQPNRLPVIADFVEGKRPVHIPKRKHDISEDDIILSVNNLDVTFGSKKKSVQAVKKVSLDVYKGETLGLVGESGCGKTTLGRAILQLIQASSGSVIYEGKPLDTLKGKALRKIRRNIQIVFQDPYSSLNPGKTIGNILAEPMHIHKLVKGKRKIETQVFKLMEQVGLPNDAINLYPHQFSGGQRQRIGIARALACQPNFIVLDESVSALDVSVQAQILNLLNDLKDEYNLTYIFISHDLTVVKYMSDRIMVMSEGEIVEAGKPEAIYLNPAQAYTRKIIDSIPR
nr:ABC transporter ATP-binding protein [Bacteroidales bacterium]